MRDVPPASGTSATDRSGRCYYGSLDAEDAPPQADDASAIAANSRATIWGWCRVVKTGSRSERSAMAHAPPNGLAQRDDPDAGRDRDQGRLGDLDLPLEATTRARRLRLRRRGADHLLADHDRARRARQSCCSGAPRSPEPSCRRRRHRHPCPPARAVLTPATLAPSSPPLVRSRGSARAARSDDPDRRAVLARVARGPRSARF